MSIESGIPFGTRVGLNGLMITVGIGALSRLVSFLLNTAMVITATPIKAYNSMYLPKDVHELILDYKFAMEQHDKHKDVLRSLGVFFMYVKYRHFIRFRWPGDALSIQVYQRFLDFFQSHTT